MRITVLTGGTSAERDVALASAVQVIAALRSIGHQVAVVDTARGFIPETDEAQLLTASVGQAPPSLVQLEALEHGLLLSGLANLATVREAEVLFLALHGGHGEDGTLQTILDMIGVPYTGSGPIGSAMAMDKDIAKRLFQEAGIPTAKWLMAPATVQEVETRLGWPVVVKPSKQGSTVGLSIVKERAQLVPAILEAFKHDDEVMLEQFIAGRELTVSILGDRALPVGEIISKKEIYDYEAKYTPGMAEEIFPAALSDDEVAAVQEQARRTFGALKLSGCARIDFRMTTDGQFYCLEANTLPGMTATSLVPQAAAAAGITFPELCERIALLAIDTRASSQAPS